RKIPIWPNTRNSKKRFWVRDRINWLRRAANSPKPAGMPTSKSALPDSTRLRGWKTPKQKKGVRGLALAREGEREKKTWKRCKPKPKLKPRARALRALALSIVPRPALPDISRRSAPTGEANVAADAVRDDAPCADAAITSRAACPRSAIC